jgi:hypothetical protein
LLYQHLPEALDPRRNNEELLPDNHVVIFSASAFNEAAQTHGAGSFGTW